MQGIDTILFSTVGLFFRLHFSAISQQSLWGLFTFKILLNGGPELSAEGPWYVGLGGMEWIMTNFNQEAKTTLVARPRPPNDIAYSHSRNIQVGRS